MTTHSNEFVTTLATIAVLAANKEELDADDAVDFAWTSVHERGDASVSEDDLERHLTLWYFDRVLVWRWERQEARAAYEADRWDREARNRLVRLNRLIARADNLAEDIDPDDL